MHAVKYQLIVPLISISRKIVIECGIFIWNELGTDGLMNGDADWLPDVLYPCSTELLVHPSLVGSKVYFFWSTTEDYCVTV